MATNSHLKKLIAIIDEAIDAFNDAMPSAEKDVMRGIEALLRELSMSNGTVTPSLDNLKLIAKIRGKLEDAFFENPSYRKSLSKYVGSFSEISALNVAYFQSIVSTYEPSALLLELERQTIDATIYNLTRGHMASNVIDPILGILRENVTTGTSFQKLSKQLRTFISGDTENLGHIQRYVQQISTDAINQYAAQYMTIVSSDLGLEWFRYDGNIIKKTRPFCRAMVTHKKWYHKAEIPALLMGKVGDKMIALDGKTGLPSGMIADTTKENFNIYRGGWNCRHHPIPVPEDNVPKEMRILVYQNYGLPYDKRTGFRKAA